MAAPVPILSKNTEFKNIHVMNIENNLEKLYQEIKHLTWKVEDLNSMKNDIKKSKDCITKQLKNYEKKEGETASILIELRSSTYGEIIHHINIIQATCEKIEKENPIPKNNVIIFSIKEAFITLLHEIMMFFKNPKGKNFSHIISSFSSPIEIAKNKIIKQEEEIAKILLDLKPDAEKLRP